MERTEDQQLKPAPGRFKQIPYYSRDVEFRQLAKRDKEFAAALRAASSDGFIDFQNERLVQQLTKSLLKADFDLDLILPPDRLCPPVPVRWNYIRWLQDLVDTTRPWERVEDVSFTDLPSMSENICGLDIGVGASCIYSLLACSARPNWTMSGTEIDTHSLSYANQNVCRNHLSQQVFLHQTDAEDPLLSQETFGNTKHLDFLMTNPPFYSSAEDMATSNSGKAANPSAVCTGAANEMICPGGDLGFATRILNESLALHDSNSKDSLEDLPSEGPKGLSVQWYTVMFGRLSSAQSLVAQLRSHHITNFAAADLRAGYKTKRWVIAWSFDDYRPRNDVARHGELVWDIMPSVTVQTIAVPLQDAKWSGRIVNEMMRDLEVEWSWRPLFDAGVMKCGGDVWSRAARRRKKQKVAVEGSSDANENGSMNGACQHEAAMPRRAKIGLAVKISCTEEKVEVRWLRGQERLLFESFCGKLKRALTGHG